ncbi:MAG: metal-dependent transcriptional regulator [Oscillospiraceae bacterium]|nr:metal-dependent transcriptional regulator [Oscillospiraceae bacterium]
MAIHESGEMYLEAILMLRKELPQVRSIDIANHTGYSKPSVSRAMGILKKNGYISVDESGFITFTDMGEKHARDIYERHNVLKQLLVNIGVSEQSAEDDACKMEHVISEETLDAIKKYLNL